MFPFGAYFGAFAGLLLVLYFTFAEATYGKTIGKAVMGLRVTTESGGRPTIGASFLRNLSKINWVLLLDVISGLVLDVGYTKKFSDRHLGDQRDSGVGASGGCSGRQNARSTP